MSHSSGCVSASDWKHTEEMLWASARLWVQHRGRQLASSAALTYGGSTSRAGADSAHSLLGNCPHLIYTLHIGWTTYEHLLSGKSLKGCVSMWRSSCAASFLHLCVAAAGISSSGGCPLPGLLPLLDPGLHHSCVQDECADHGSHSSVGSWGCLCLHLLEEGKDAVSYLSSQSRQTCR